MGKKKSFVLYFADVSTCVGRTYFHPKKTVLLCSCNWSCFHLLLTLANLYYRVTGMFII